MPIKKHFILVGYFMLLILFTMGCGSNSKEADGKSTETIKLKLSHYFPASADLSKNFIEEYMKRITELTDGRVQFDYYPGGQLGAAGDVLNLVSDGVTDISYFSSLYFSDAMPLGSSLIGMPGLYETTSQGLAAFLKVSNQNPMLETDFLKNGVRPIALSITPSYEIFSGNKEIKTPEDLKGFKIRGSGGVFTEVLNFLGAIPIQVGPADMYNAYSTGVIDGVNVSYESLKSYSLEELTKHATRGINFAGAPVGLIINEDVFQGLPQDIQEVILKTGEEISKSYTEHYVAQNDKVFEEFKAAEEMNIHEITENELEQWQKKYDEFEEGWLEKQDSENFNTVLELFKEELENIK